MYSRVIKKKYKIKYSEGKPLDLKNKKMTFSSDACVNVGGGILGTRG